MSRHSRVLTFLARHSSCGQFTNYQAAPNNCAMTIETKKIFTSNILALHLSIEQFDNSLKTSFILRLVEDVPVDNGDECVHSENVGHSIQQDRHRCKDKLKVCSVKQDVAQQASATLASRRRMKITESGRALVYSAASANARFKAAGVGDSCERLATSTIPCYQPVANTLQSKTLDVIKCAEHIQTITSAVGEHRRSAEEGRTPPPPQVLKPGSVPGSRRKLRIGRSEELEQTVEKIADNDDLKLFCKNVLGTAEHY
uniref:Uncharacterized protein n=1 Tax=Timema tahoe TaxID=61484 RepID=A0A7R9IF37_9NEOP|nr:unnamed protein product [Timema tahoe]